MMLLLHSVLSRKQVCVCGGGGGYGEGGRTVRGLKKWGREGGE